MNKFTITREQTNNALNRLMIGEISCIKLNVAEEIVNMGDKDTYNEDAFYLMEEVINNNGDYTQDFTNITREMAINKIMRCENYLLGINEDILTKTPKSNAKNLIDLLMESEIDEICLNVGQGILYDATEEQLYLADFEDDDHQYITKSTKINVHMAINNIVKWEEIFQYKK